jgi:hypothetical protein
MLTEPVIPLASPLVDLAVVNDETATAHAIAQVLACAGWTTAIRTVRDFQRGRIDRSAFLRWHEPRVVIWDIGYPYDEHWAYFAATQALPAARGRAFILTSGYPAALREFVLNAAWSVATTPLDRQTLCQAVRSVLHAA